MNQKKANINEEFTIACQKFTFLGYIAHDTLSGNSRGRRE